MNKKQTPSQKMAQLLQQKRSSPSAVPGEIPEDLINEIAGDNNAIEALDALRSTLDETPSSLRDQVTQQHEFDAALELLGAYIEAELSGADPAQRYPEVAQAIQENELWQAEYEALRLSMAEPDLFVDAPTFVPSEQWHPLQNASTTSNAQLSSSSQSSSSSSVWKELESGVHRIISEISVLLDNTSAIFGQLPGQLQPQPVAIGAFRSDPSTDPGKTERIELSHPDGELITRIQLGPVQAGRATLIVETLDAEASQGIPNTPVALCDEEGELLERALTNPQGQVIFEQLEPELYQIRLEHLEPAVEFTVRFQSRQ